MPGWLLTTLAAALLQTWRTALQQRLRDRFSVGTAGLVRYLYAVPVGVVLLTTYVAIWGGTLPVPGWRFVLGCAAAGLAQVIGTSLLIMAFGYRSFAVGTAYAKTDAVQAALLGAVLLHESLSVGAWAGIAIGVAGVQTLSLAGQRGMTWRALLQASAQPAALCGVGAGAGFALTGVAIKWAVQTTTAPDPILAALCALVLTNTLQTLMQGGWMAWREPAGLRMAFTGWRSAMWVGVLSGLGSAGWFTAFAQAPVALVRTVGQVDMVFTLLFSRFYLREQVRPLDALGLVLVVAGVITVLLFH